MERTVEAVEQISEAEARFERWRRASGLFLAPAVFVVLLLLPLPGLKPEAHRLAAVMAAVVVLWVTEALPLPVTALAGAAACVVLRVAPAKEVFAPFADPLMFLFIGSFILARAIFLNKLDRRLAFGVLSLRFRRGDGLHLGVDFQHRHDRHDVRHRHGDPRLPFRQRAGGRHRYQSPL